MKTIVLLAVVCTLFAGVAYAEKVADRPEEITPVEMSRLDCITTGYDYYAYGSGGAIPDCDPIGLLIGPLATMDTGTIEDVIFFIDIEHTWIGDLRVWLLYDVDCDVAVDVQGEVLCRHSLEGCPEDGCCGCSGDLAGWYGFDDTVASIEDVCPTSFTPGCYGPDYDSAGLDVFDGMPSGGCFYLFVADGACADVGTVSDWEVYLLTSQPGGGALDIKPMSCPNPLNVKSRGVLPVAILGGEAFDAAMVDPETVRLEGVAPIRWNLSDVSTPVGPDAEPCDCTEEGPDGYQDLTLKFKTQEIVQAIGDYEDGDVIELTATGTMFDGTPFEFSDCVWILDRGKGPEVVGQVAPAGPGSDDRPTTDGESWSTIKALYR